MFPKELNYFLILCASSLLSGCWDQEPLREASLAYSVGADITEENKLQQTIELVKVQAESNLHLRMKYIQQPGHNIMDTGDALKNVTGNIRYFKYGVQLLGTKILKKGILPI